MGVVAVIIRDAVRTWVFARNSAVGKGGRPRASWIEGRVRMPCSGEAAESRRRHRPSVGNVGSDEMTGKRLNQASANSVCGRTNGCPALARTNPFRRP